jgi:hypothetical protein
MEDFVRIFQTSTGDVYHITLSEGHSVPSAEAIDALKDVSIVGIELRRLAGRNATGQEVLAAIESTIAEYFVSHENYKKLKIYQKGKQTSSFLHLPSALSPLPSAFIHLPSSILLQTSDIVQSTIATLMICTVQSIPCNGYMRTL